MKRLKLCVLFAVVAFFVSNMYADSTTVRLTAEQKGEIEQVVKNRVIDFISYLPEIAATTNKSAEKRRLAKRYKERALKLFIGQGNDYPYIDAHGNERMHDAVTMQTTSRGRKNKPKKLTTYLDRLMALPYHRVEVDTCQAVRLNNDIHKVGDNRWACTVYFVQTFKAYNREGDCVIHDRDAKKVTVYIDREKVFDAKTGKINEYYVVQLGDISIYTDYVYEDW